MKYKLIIAAFFLTTKLWAQEKRQVLDKTTGLSIGYVTINVLHTSKGIVGSATGEFILSIDPQDTLMLSCAGYQTTKITGKDIKTIIYMEPRVVELSQVFINSKKNVTKIFVGNEKNITKSDLEWGASSIENYTEFAQKIFFSDSSSFLKITKVFVPFKKIGKCMGTFLLRIYSPDSLNNQPGIEILNKIIGGDNVVKQKNTMVIDISSYNLFFNGSDSFFVSISWPPESFASKCKMSIPMSKLSNSPTYCRSFTTGSFHWFPFGKIKDPGGKEFEIKTFLSIEADVYK